MQEIINVKPLSGYRVYLKYSDGITGEVGLSDLAGRGVFKAWDDRKIFEAVRIHPNGFIAWPGELDLCPDALYMQLTGKKVEEVFPGFNSDSDKLENSPE